MTTPTTPKGDELDAQLDKALWKAFRLYDKVANGPVPARFLTISDPDVDPLGLVHAEAKAAIQALITQELEAKVKAAEQEYYFKGYGDGRTTAEAEATQELEAQVLELAAKADAEYNRSEIDNWTFALGEHTHNLVIQAERANPRKEK